MAWVENGGNKQYFKSGLSMKLEVQQTGLMHAGLVNAGRSHATSYFLIK